MSSMSLVAAQTRGSVPDVILDTPGYGPGNDSFIQNSTNRRACLLGLLFEASCPLYGAEADILRPLWAEEAMHRASNILNFVLLLERLKWENATAELTPEDEYALANSLASGFRALNATADRKVLVPCAQLLREVVSDVVGLFGRTVGKVDLEVRLAPVTLAGYRRKALVLAANELVFNALKHAFTGYSYGRIVVSLSHVGANQAKLTVEDDGNGIAISRPGAAFGIIGGLAGILEAELLYRRSRFGGTSAEIEFPVG